MPPVVVRPRPLFPSAWESLAARVGMFKGRWLAGSGDRSYRDSSWRRGGPAWQVFCSILRETTAAQSRQTATSLPGPRTLHTLNNQVDVTGACNIASPIAFGGADR